MESQPNTSNQIRQECNNNNNSRKPQAHCLTSREKDRHLMAIYEETLGAETINEASVPFGILLRVLL